jgi:hypothetical protein
VEDLQKRLEKLLIDAEDCALIARLAPDVKKRDLFNRLVTDLRGMAIDVEATIAHKHADQPKSRGQVEKLKSGEFFGCDR